MNHEEFSEVQLDRAPSSILVDEDALTPRFRAQMEAILVPLSLLFLLALFISRMRQKVVADG